jgi:DNA modification methylase
LKLTSNALKRGNGADTKPASTASVRRSRADQCVRISTQLEAERGQRSADKAADGLAVVYRCIAELKLDPKNPRSHSRRQIGQIAHSIEAFGFIVPVLVDANLKVIAGHGRVMAAQLLGWSQVPTIRIDYLSETQARAFMIADNRLTENSVWDDRILAEQLKALSVLDLGFSLEVTGFDMGEIDLRIEGLSSDESAAAADDLSQVPSGPAVTQPGDIWQLGEHRVLCGSAIDDSAYATLLGEERADMVFSDPPYNVRIDGHVSGLGAVGHREFEMAAGEMTQAEFTMFLNRACSLLGRYSADGSLHYICIDWRHMAELLAAGASVYSELKNVCVWTKNNAGMGSFYRSQHELIFVYKFGRGMHRNNIKLGQYGRNRTNVWSYAGATAFERSGDEGNLLALHPTVKPVAMVADAIVDCTSRRALVLDGFLGSGTTVIAGERTGRRCYGLEIDPLYVDVIVRRWQTFTRAQARHLVSGRWFAEVEAASEKMGLEKP